MTRTHTRPRQFELLGRTTTLIPNTDGTRWWITAWSLAQLLGYAPSGLRSTVARARKRGTLPNVIQVGVSQEGRALLQAEGHRAPHMLKREWMLSREDITALKSPAHKDKLAQIAQQWPPPPNQPQRPQQEPQQDTQAPPAPATATAPPRPRSATAPGHLAPDAPRKRWSQKGQPRDRLHRVTAAATADDARAAQEAAALITGAHTPILTAAELRAARVQALAPRQAPRQAPILLPDEAAHSADAFGQVRQALALCREIDGAALDMGISTALQRETVRCLTQGQRQAPDAHLLGNHWGAPEPEEIPERTCIPAAPEATRARWAWSDQYLEAAKEVVGRVFVKAAPLAMDQRAATDLIISGEISVAVRVRRHGVAARYPWNITLRTSGRDCERDKLLEGRGARWLLYAHAAREQPGHPPTFERWVVVNLRELNMALRRADLRPGLREGNEPARQKDQDGFWWVDLSTCLWAEAVRATSHPNQLQTARDKHRQRLERKAARERREAQAAQDKAQQSEATQDHTNAREGA